MARQSRRKRTGVLGTLMVELSALAGILGIAQPAVRNNLWKMLQPPSANSQLDPSVIGPVNIAPVASAPQSATALPPSFEQSAPQPQVLMPGYAPSGYQSTYPPAYTAQAILPRDLRSRAGWRPSGYNPMGTYQ